MESEQVIGKFRFEEIFEGSVTPSQSRAFMEALSQAAKDAGLLFKGGTVTRLNDED